MMSAFGGALGAAILAFFYERMGSRGRRIVHWTSFAGIVFFIILGSMLAAAIA